MNQSHAQLLLTDISVACCVRLTRGTGDAGEPTRRCILMPLSCLHTSGICYATPGVMLDAPTITTIIPPRVLVPMLVLMTPLHA